MFSFWGLSRTLPNISELEAWYILMEGSTRRMASSIRVTPRAVNSPVSTGWFQLVGTKDWAARL